LENFESKVGFDIRDGKSYKYNLVNVEIYFEEFNYESITSSPAYTVSFVLVSSHV